MDTDISFYLYLGITHAAVWAACCSFIAHNTDAELRPSAQSFIQGLHHGFGKFCGAVFGGMAIQNLGTVMVFRIYGGVCAVFLILFIAVNFFNRNEGGFSDEVDPELVSSYIIGHTALGQNSKKMPIHFQILVLFNMNFLKGFKRKG